MKIIGGVIGLCKKIYRFCVFFEFIVLDIGIIIMVLVFGRVVFVLVVLIVIVAGFELGAAVTITFLFILVFLVLDSIISVVVLGLFLFSNVWVEVGALFVVFLLIIIGFVLVFKLFISTVLFMLMNCKKRKLS